MRTSILAAATALLALLSPLAASAARLDLPVSSRSQTPAAPYYDGTRLEVRLAPAAARALATRRAGPTRAGLNASSGLRSLDAVASALGGATFAPSFVGEVPPVDPSDPLDFTAFLTVHLPAGASLADAIDRFRASPDVMSAEPIAITPVSALPNDSLFAQQVWMHKDVVPRTDTRILDAWNLEQGDTSIVVGVIDTGIIPYHPDLGGSIAGGYGNMYTNWAEANGVPGVDDDGNGFIDDVHGWDFVANASAATASSGEDWRDADNDPNDFAGHGTTVAGVIGAIGDNTIGMAGMVPKVRMMGLRIGWLAPGQIPPNGNVDMGYAAQAIRYAARVGVQVVNCSFSSITLSSLDAALTAASRAGTIVVDAAGNGSDPNYIGTREDVIAVAGVDSSDVLWPFSVFGPWVDLSADATGLVSTFLQRTSPDSVGNRQGAYRGFLNGTSYSTPQVASAVALMQAQRLHQNRRPLTVQGAVMRLRETADDIRALNPGATNYGTGRLNVLRALSDPTGSLAIRTRARQTGAPVILRDNLGRTTVLIAASDKSLVAYDGASGDTLWRVALPFVPAGNMAAAILGPGRGVGVFIPSTTGRIMGYRDDGTTLPGWPVLAANGQQMLGGAALGDLDGDGVLEVVCGSNDGRMWAWHADGTLLPDFPFDTGTIGAATPALGDLDGIAGDEIAFAGADGQIHVLRADASEAPGWPQTAPPVARAPVIARFSGPGQGPTLVVGGNGTLAGYAGDGTARFSTSFAGTLGQDLALGDLDGDGVDEVVYVTGAPTTVSVIDSIGAPFTRQNWPLTLANPPAGAVLMGPVRADHRTGLAWLNATVGLQAFDDSAHVVPWLPKTGLAGVSPAMADLDGDGATELIAGISNVDSLLYVYDAGPNSWDRTAVAWPTVRGDDARRADRAQPFAPLVIDRIRPARVNDLIADARIPAAALVRFTMTGDDSLLGRAARIELRHAAFPLDESNFTSGQLDPTAPPDSAGVRDSVLVTGLIEGQTYWFALRVFDRAGNASALSNVDTLLVPSLAPATVSDLRVSSTGDSSVTLAWTASGDDGAQGRPASYIIAIDGAPLTPAGFDAAPRQVTVAATVDAGGAESARIGGLTPGAKLYFALVAVDHTLARSPLSNGVAAIVPVGGALRGRVGVALAPRARPSNVPVAIDWQGAAEAVGMAQHITIHDLTGRAVRRIEVGTSAGGTALWDGRDDDGRSLRAGMYFARLDSGSRHAETRVVLIR